MVTTYCMPLLLRDGLPTEATNGNDSLPSPGNIPIWNWGGRERATHPVIQHQPPECLPRVPKGPLLFVQNLLGRLVPTPLFASICARVLAGQLKGHRQPLAHSGPSPLTFSLQPPLPPIRLSAASSTTSTSRSSPNSPSFSPSSCYFPANC